MHPAGMSQNLPDVAQTLPDVAQNLPDVAQNLPDKVVSAFAVRTYLHTRRGPG